VYTFLKEMKVKKIIHISMKIFLIFAISSNCISEKVKKIRKVESTEKKLFIATFQEFYELNRLKNSTYFFHPEKN